MGKKNRGNNAARRAAADPARSAFLIVTEKTSVTEVLSHALTSLDAVAEESHRRQQRDVTAYATHGSGNSGTAALGSRKRGRGATAAGGVEEGDAAARSEISQAHEVGSTTPSAVYAALARQHYETITTAVAAFGLQLLPVLHEIVRRVGLAMSTPSLASPDVWETAAVLCSYYGAGPAARMVEELLEVLVRARGVLLLDAACVVGDAQAAAAVDNPALPKLTHAEMVAEGNAVTDVAATTHRILDDSLLDAVNRKLVALANMLAAVGPYLPTSLVRRVAVRFAQEVVEGGMLSVEVALAQGSGRGSVADGAAGRRYWRVPVICQASCLELLRALLMLRCAPAELAVCAGRVVAEVTSSLHRGALVRPVQTPEPEKYGHDTEVTTATAVRAATMAATAHQCWPSFVVYRELVAAAVQLRQTVAFLRHPATLPLYRPPTVVEEMVASKVLVMAPAAVTTTELISTGDSAGTVPASVATVTATEVAAVPPSVGASATALHPAMAAPTPRTGPGIPTPPPPAPVRSTTTAHTAPAAQPAAPAPAYIKETLTTAQTVRPRAPVDDDNESIPDIDMDDE